MTDSLVSSDDNRRMFGAIADRYDLMNRLLSLGMDSIWRHRAVDLLKPQKSCRYLDIGCGTGDVALEVAGRVDGADVVGGDPVKEMLELAEKKDSSSSVRWVGMDALDLPCADGSFSGVISAFCLRNLVDRRRAFKEICRALKGGGLAVMLDLTVPQNILLRFLHMIYSHTIVPLAGLMAGQRSAYGYLVQSIEAFVSPVEIVEEMKEAGMVDVGCRRLCGGIVTLFYGSSPGGNHE